MVGEELLLVELKVRNISFYLYVTLQVQQINCENSLLLSQETCLANITKGLQLHLNLLKEINKVTTLAQTDQVKDLQAEIKELLLLIEEVCYLTWGLLFC